MSYKIEYANGRTDSGYETIEAAKDTLYNEVGLVDFGQMEGKRMNVYYNEEFIGEIVVV